MEEQLYAIFAAAKGRPLKVMFPMVSSVEEFIEAKAFACKTAGKHGLDIASIRFGIMVEVPSVLFSVGKTSQHLRRACRRSKSHREAAEDRHGDPECLTQEYCGNQRID